MIKLDMWEIVAGKAQSTGRKERKRNCLHRKIFTVTKASALQLVNMPYILKPSSRIHVIGLISSLVPPS